MKSFIRRDMIMMSLWSLRCQGMQDQLQLHQQIHLEQPLQESVHINNLFNVPLRDTDSTLLQKHKVLLPRHMDTPLLDLYPRHILLLPNGTGINKRNHGNLQSNHLLNNKVIHGIRNNPIDSLYLGMGNNRSNNRRRIYPLNGIISTNNGIKIDLEHAPLLPLPHNLKLIITEED